MTLPIVETVPNQFPVPYLTEGPNFIAFVQAYYEWMQQEGNPLWFTNKIRDFQDLDKTLDQFLYHFQNELMNLIPGDIVADSRLVMKHIIDLYRAKGSKRGLELLFRIVFNEDIKLYLPGTDVFTLSDNQWVQNSYLEVSDNQFLSQLVGQVIISSGNEATALVESYDRVAVNNILVNVLTISHIIGQFNNGDYILSNDVIDLNTSNAPQIIGSLSAITILSGGENFKIGDLLNVRGDVGGSGAIAKVVSTTEQNGEVNFNIIDGGKGYSLNAVVSVVDGGGTGATFQVGSLTNRSILAINTDLLGTYYNTALESNSGPTFTLNYSGGSGTFTTNEVVNSSINAVAVDFSYIIGQSLNQFETLSNTALGISVNIATLDNPSFMRVVGGIPNSNLGTGAILHGATSGNTVIVNSVSPLETIAGNGIVTVINSTSMTVSNATGYFLPTSTIHGGTSGATGNLQVTTRLTNWGFPANPGNTNLDTSLQNALSVTTLTVGTIATLTNINPGKEYSSNPTVTVTEPFVLATGIPDGMGGFWGGDANVQASAASSNGIVTALQVVESGYGFAGGSRLFASSPNLNIVVTGAAIVDSQGTTQGHWAGKQSMLSDTNFLYDSDYYQQFSYEIQVPLMLNKYKQLVENVMGPAGYNIFGRFSIRSTQNSASQILEYKMNQS